MLEKWPSLIFWPGLKGTAGAGPSDQQLSGPPGPIPPDLHDQRMYACCSGHVSVRSRPECHCTRRVHCTYLLASRRLDVPCVHGRHQPPLGAVLVGSAHLAHAHGPLASSRGPLYQSRSAIARGACIPRTCLPRGGALFRACTETPTCTLGGEIRAQLR